MKTHTLIKKTFSVFFLTFLLLIGNVPASATDFQTAPGIKDAENFTEYKGKIVDKKSGTPLSFASITLFGTNVSTVTNAEGEFSLKVSKEIQNPKAVISFIGYKNKTVLLADITPQKLKIEMEPSAVELPELNVISKDANVLIQAVLDKKGENYFSELTPMTAFYRETIKKNRTYVSLSEAVVQISKQPYTSYKTDIAKLYKSRKKADYTRLDTVTFKLQGGPFNSLYLDIMKNPDMIFTENMFENYEFSFDRSTHMDNRLIYVLDFKQKPNKSEPLYYGKLYIDAQNLALKTAVFKLNITNREEASKMFIVKKPFNANAYPIETNYRIDYSEKNGKWYYNYSRIEFGLRIIWKKKLFNTNYFSTVEMAVTDWGKDLENQPIKNKDRIHPSVIISDEASGFSDPEFWGEYNVIEPEKSIEVAIKKIQKQLEKK